MAIARVKKYQSKKEQLVLGMVKKYPLYSLNKLNEKLPEFSRHSIQRILEKNLLSTVEERLAFASKNKEISLPSLESINKKLSFLMTKLPAFEGIKRRFKDLFGGFQVKQVSPTKLVVLGGLVLLIWLGTNFIFNKQPQISLEHPPMDFTNEGENLFVIGKVIPKYSRVVVNGKEVALNGDGSFTTIAEIPPGESILEVGATLMGSESKVLRLVRRSPTQEELRAQQEKEAQEKLAAVDKMAELERSVNDLMAAKNAVVNQGGVKKAFLRILNNQVKKEADFISVTGEVANLGQEAASWVMITTKFFNNQGGVVDTKYGFATDFDEIINPGEKKEFITQPTVKEFDHYSLEISWEEGVVAGIATESAEKKKEAVSKED